MNFDPWGLGPLTLWAHGPFGSLGPFGIFDPSPFGPLDPEPFWPLGPCCSGLPVAGFPSQAAAGFHGLLQVVKGCHRLPNFFSCLRSSSSLELLVMRCHSLRRVAMGCHRCRWLPRVVMGPWALWPLGPLGPLWVLGPFGALGPLGPTDAPCCHEANYRHRVVAQLLSEPCRKLGLPRMQALSQLASRPHQWLHNGPQGPRRPKGLKRAQG